MTHYRSLTAREISALEANGCQAENWANIQVDKDFEPSSVRNVFFYGENQLGSFKKCIEVSKGFFKRTGIFNATLRNVTIGDNCLVENIGNFINNYTIGEECYISNVCTMETTPGATYGEGNLISVLNEIGDGNAILFKNLNSQFASFMVRHFGDEEIKSHISRLINEDIKRNAPSRGTIHNHVKIVNTKEITNTVVHEHCEINGASRISDCSILSKPHAKVYIGTGVICENSIISDGSSIINSVKIQDCFVGESCQVSNGFTASQSLFFANSFMANGEACAAFCGPFSASHHKSSLLIGGMFSFYNAGSATNFSNHAYKMGPLHYGILERGTKTASGAYLLMPAHIGTFSVCFGKLMHHPNTQNLPFSYLIAAGDIMRMVPGRNITTVGLYRDIRKWPNRDNRPQECHKSIVNFDWLSPFSVGSILEGKQILEKLREASGDNVSTYNYHEYVISASSLQKGIKNYDIALRVYMGAVLKRAKKHNFFSKPTTSTGLGKWDDLAGLLLPESEELRLIKDIKNGTLDTIQQVIDRFTEINNNYHKYQWTWTYKMICDYYGIEEITEEYVKRIQTEYIIARRAWIAEIKKDAEKEFAMGDVEEKLFKSFMTQLDHEVDYETWQ